MHRAVPAPERWARNRSPAAQPARREAGARPSWARRLPDPDPEQGEGCTPSATKLATVLGATSPYIPRTTRPMGSLP